MMAKQNATFAVYFQRL